MFLLAVSKGYLGKSHRKIFNCYLFSIIASKAYVKNIEIHFIIFRKMFAHSSVQILLLLATGCLLFDNVQSNDRGKWNYEVYKGSSLDRLNLKVVIGYNKNIRI